MNTHLLAETKLNYAGWMLKALLFPGPTFIGNKKIDPTEGL